MIANYYISKDASIYSKSQSMNAGIDEVLEIAKTVNADATKNYARTLIYFDWASAYNELTGSFSTFKTQFDADGVDYKLKLFSTKPENIRYSYTIEATVLQESWENGIGRTDHTPQTEEGVSWAFRDASGSTNWSTLGGHIYSTQISTQSFEFEDTDINMDISESLVTIHAGINNGMLLRFSSSLEDNSLDYGTLRFFSRDTNTIYAPKLQIGWDDSVYSTGSLSPASSDEILIYVKNNKYEYNEKEIVRFEIRARDIYTTQTYASSSAALDVLYLPTGSFYSIKDAETEEDIISFNDNYTKISCTSSGNFFNVSMKALQPERLYKIVFKVNNRNYDGQVEHFDANHFFKVVR